MTRFPNGELEAWLGEIRNCHQSELGRALLDLRDCRREIADLYRLLEERTQQLRDLRDEVTNG